MKQKILTTLMLFFLALAVNAATIHGHVYFGPDDQATPFPEHTVLVRSADGTAVETQTDHQGYYSFEFDVAPGTVFTAVVSTLDFCTGEELSVTVTLVEDPDNNSVQVDFNVCADLDPPDPTACEAFFDYEQMSVDPYTIQFFDLSYTGPASLLTSPSPKFHSQLDIFPSSV